MKPLISSLSVALVFWFFTCRAEANTSEIVLGISQETSPRDTYRRAQSMQTHWRRIPITGGVDGKPVNYHWTQLVKMYKREVADLKAQVEFFTNPEPEDDIQKYLSESIFEILSGPDKPVVDEGSPGTHDIVAVFDGGPESLGLPNMFGYSLSRDGIHWRWDPLVKGNVFFHTHQGKEMVEDDADSPWRDT